MRLNIQNKRDDKEDLKWVRKAKKGNRKAFDQLVLKYRKRIYFAVRKMVLDHDDSNDIVQDTFVKAYIKMDQFNEQFPFYPWLHRIAINTTLNQQGKVTRRKESFSIDSDEEPELIESSDEDKTPLNVMIHDELEKIIARAMEHLPLDQRMVFVLRTSEGLSYQEISQQLSISMGTVMSRLSRAREKLKDLLEPYFINKDIEV